MTARFAVADRVATLACDAASLNPTNPLLPCVGSSSTPTSVAGIFSASCSRLASMSAVAWPWDTAMRLGMAARFTVRFRPSRGCSRLASLPATAVTVMSSTVSLPGGYRTRRTRCWLARVFERVMRWMFLMEFQAGRMLGLGMVTPTCSRTRQQQPASQALNVRVPTSTQHKLACAD